LLLLNVFTCTTVNAVLIYGTHFMNEILVLKCLGFVFKYYNWLCAICYIVISKWWVFIFCLKSLRMWWFKYFGFFLLCLLCLLFFRIGRCFVLCLCTYECIIFVWMEMRFAMICQFVFCYCYKGKDKISVRFEILGKWKNIVSSLMNIWIWILSTIGLILVSDSSFCSVKTRNMKEVQEKL